MSTDPVPVALPTDWWTTADVLAYCASRGQHVPRGTWVTWVSRGEAPKADPAGRIGNYPRWKPGTIRVWFSGRFPELG